MNIEVLLGIIAGLIHVVGFIIYHRQVLQGLSRPNRATWTLWVLISTLNCVSYIAMTRDVVKGILPIASTCGCIMVFVVSLFKGKLSKLNFWDNIVLMFGLMSIFIWSWYRSATYANLLLQISIFVSFVSTFRAVWKDSSNEKALPWFIWAFAYVLAIIVVFLRWQGHYVDLVYPIHGLVLHGIVGILSFKKPKGGF